MKTKIIIAAVLMALLGLMYFLAPKNTKTTDNSTDTVATTSTDTAKPVTVTSGGTTSTTASKTTITIANGTFTPQILTIKKGTTVTWVNKDSVVRTIVADNLGPTSPPLKYGATYSYKFGNPGIYGYRFSTDQATRGTIIVQQP